MTKKPKEINKKEFQKIIGVIFSSIIYKIKVATVYFLHIPKKK